MVIYRNAQRSLGGILPDDIFIELFFYLTGLGQGLIPHILLPLAA